jgi:hypothetical protein
LAAAPDDVRYWVKTGSRPMAGPCPLSADFVAKVS